jgi:hypothetical protein
MKMQFAHKTLPDDFEKVAGRINSVLIEKDKIPYSPGDLIRFYEWTGRATGRQIIRKILHVEESDREEYAVLRLRALK